jgi:hypothetical protein
MYQLSPIERFELEIDIRQYARNIAHYGTEGIDFFCQHFPDIAKEYSLALKKERNETIHHHFPKKV